MRIARRLLLLAALLSGSLLLSVGDVRAADADADKGRGSWFTFGSGKSKPAAKTKNLSNASETSKPPGMIKQITTAPKRLVSTTKSMLTPKSQPAEKTTPIPPAKNPKEPQQGFFQSLFNPEPPPPPQTIKDWMKLKQIHP